MHRPAPLVLTAALVLGVAASACDDDDDGSGGSASTTSSTSGTGGSGGEAGGGGTASGAGGTTSGTGGGGGMGGDGGGGQSAGTEGCGEPLTDPTEQWVAKTVNAGGTERDYFVYLPASYDPQRPYPVVYQFHGCSGNPDKQNNNPPVQNHSGADAIHVRGRAIDNCWDNSANGTGVALFDALVPAVEAAYCADPDRRFATGYSSGAFMTHRLACNRGDMLRGVASIAGGLGGNNCVGQVAALLIHDDTDSTVNITASEQARDRHLTNNGCDAQAATSPTNHPPCEAYADCAPDYPVVWCQTTGQGHSRQDSLSAPAFWDFLAAL